MTAREQARYCQELADLIAGCDPDNPDEQTVEAIEHHIEHCPACQRAETFLATTVSRLRAHGPTDITQSFEKRLVDQLCARSPHSES